MNILLHALTLSQSAHLALTSYKRTLYRESDCISAIALPPLIPLSWAPSESGSAPPYITPLTEPLVTGTIPLRMGDSWYLPTDWTVKAEGGDPHSIQGLFTIYPGIYLCAAEEGFIPSPLEQPCRVTDLWLAAFRLTVRETVSWWEDLFVSTLSSRHIR